MGRVRELRTLSGVLVVVAMSAALAGCVAPGGGGSTVTPTVVSPTPSATATPTTSATPTPTVAPEPSTPKPETPETPPTAPPAAGVASVEIVNSGYDAAGRSVSVAAMVTNVVSAEGICVLTVSQGDTSVSAQQPGMPDASVTYCANLAVTLPEGAAGTWTATVAFTDPGSTGSASTQVVVS